VNALVVPNIDLASLRITADAQLQKDNALHGAKTVLAVTDADSQQVAVNHLAILKRFLKDLEASRTDVKKPAIDLGKKIDALAKETAAEVEIEVERINKIVSDFLRAQQAKAEAKRKFQESIDRKRQEQLALEAKSLKEQGRTEEAAEVVQQVAIVAAQQPKPLMTPPKAHGMSARTVWKFEVLNAREILAVRPDLVKVEASPIDINRAIAAGLRECAGLRIYEDIQTSVRAA